MARTRREMATAVLQQLRLVTTGLPAAAEDIRTIIDQYEDVYAELVDRGLCYWPNSSDTAEEIPNVVFRAVVNILTGEVADVFGKEEPMTTDDGYEPVSARVKGFRDLRRHMAKRPSGEATPFSSY